MPPVTETFGFRGSVFPWEMDFLVGSLSTEPSRDSALPPLLVVPPDWQARLWKGSEESFELRELGKPAEEPGEEQPPRKQQRL